MTACYHLGSRAGVIATLLGIYPPYAHWIHFGFALQGALLLNALGKYSALFEVHIPKLRSHVTLCSAFPSPITGKTEIPGFDMKVMNLKRRFLVSEYMSRGKLCKSSHSS